MRAVVVEKPNEVVLRDLETPAPGAGEALVRSHFAGVCGTDVAIATGEFVDPRWVRFPVVLGHEWSGTIAEIGSGVTDLAVGDRVVCEGTVPCGHCGRCRRGQTNLCENYDQIGFTRSGGYGEFVLVPRRVVHRLPDRVSLEEAVLIEPGSCVLRAFRRGDPKPGARVGVIGVGTLGSLALTLARLYSPGALLAFGLREHELELATRIGAEALNVLDDDAIAGVAGSLDLVVECAGTPEAVELATRLVRLGGHVVLLGISGEGKRLELPADRLVLGDMTVVGNLSYDSATWTDLITLLDRGLVELAPLITHRFGIADFAEAFELLQRPRGLVTKVVLEHDAS
jgi:threonine dehydrogenase-like Zn-dependent dehydrogenase